MSVFSESDHSSASIRNHILWGMLLAWIVNSGTQIGIYVAKKGFTRCWCDCCCVDKKTVEKYASPSFEDTGSSTPCVSSVTKTAFMSGCGRLGVAMFKSLLKRGSLMIASDATTEWKLGDEFTWIDVGVAAAGGVAISTIESLRINPRRQLTRRRPANPEPAP